MAWFGYLFSYPDSAFYFAQKQFEFAKSVHDSLQMGNALNTQGVSHSIRGDYGNASQYMQQCLDIRLAIYDTHGIAKAYMNYASVFQNQQAYVKALELYEKSLAISEPNNYNRLISTTLNNIGNIYINQRDYEKALDFYSRGLGLALSIDDKRGQANIYNNLS